MKMKEPVDISTFYGKDVKHLDDMTLRNIIYQHHHEWNSSFSRADLELIARDAIKEHEEDQIALAAWVQKIDH